MVTATRKLKHIPVIKITETHRTITIESLDYVVKSMKSLDLPASKMQSIDFIVSKLYSFIVVTVAFII